jgi:calcineurin-like phosphoesterase family protein
MARLFFISDIHLGHANIRAYRPEFSSVEEHDNTIFDNILTTVTKRDTLWMLGDSCFTEERFKMIETISESVGYFHYIPGNHDTDNAKRQEMYKEMVKRGFFKKTGSMFKHKGFWLTHPPIHSMELRGCKNIHGHTHNVKMLDASGKVDKNYINVCVEHTEYAPINFETIKDMTL